MISWLFGKVVKDQFLPASCFCLFSGFSLLSNLYSSIEFSMILNALSRLFTAPIKAPACTNTPSVMPAAWFSSSFLRPLYALQMSTLLENELELIETA